MSFADLGYRFLRVARNHVSSFVRDMGREVDEWSKRRTTERGRFPGTRGFYQRDEELEKHYARLEIPYGSDEETAKRAWRELLKRFHPDRHAEDPEQYSAATELTTELTRSYQEIVRAIGERRV